MAIDNYDLDPAVGAPGARATMENYDARSLTAEADLPFGAVAVQGTTDREADVMSAGASPLGIVYRDPLVPAGNGEQYKAGDTATICTRGTFWITAGEAVSAGDGVTFADDGTFGPTGLNEFPGGATYVDSGSAGDLVRINLK